MSLVSFIFEATRRPNQAKPLEPWPTALYSELRIQCGQTVADRNQSRPALLSQREQAK
jgi:hypothetical protein